MDKNLSSQLPSYVNNTLSDAERAKVESQLQQSPQARAEAAWLASVRDHIQSTPDERLPMPDAGLGLLMARIEAEKAGKVVALPRPQKQAAWWYKPAFAVAAAVMVVQAFVLQATLFQGPGAESIRALSGNRVSVQPGDILQISFKENASEAQIRNILAAIDGEIVGGPGAIGVYQVRVGKGQGNAVLAMLQQKKGIVDSVNLAKD
ncbi:MAG: hypothetical protein HYS18_03015 [Burkholderiales bacterium]|nr:hypothetical protein [Burkholderiales bacterium]